LPGLEMLGVGAHRHVRLETGFAQRIGQRRAVHEIVERLGVGQQVEDEDLHGSVSLLFAGHGPTCMIAAGQQAVNRWARGHGQAYADLFFSRIRRHTCSDVSGISRSVTPSEASASSAAPTSAAGAPIEPASPQPLAPSGLWVQGWLSSHSVTKSGTSSARTMA